MDVEKLRCRLSEYGQEHLLGFFDQLGESEKEALYKELCDLNLAQVKQNFELTIEESKSSDQKDGRLEPVSASLLGSVATAGQDQLKTWQETGLEAIAENKVAVLLLAGGQGTRLNVPYPKGMYSVGLPSGKTLYQIQAERILKVQKLAEEHSGKACTVPW